MRSEIPTLLADLLGDLQQVSVLWQLGVLLVSIGLAWQLKRFARPRIAKQREAEGTLRISVGSLERVIFPLSALGLVFLGRWVLHYWHSVKLLNIAIPLFFSLALIRVAVYMLRRIFAPGSWLRTWERFIAWAVWIGVALYITGLLPEIFDLLDGLSFAVGKQKISVLLILQGVLSVAVTMLFALWLGSTLESRIMGTTAVDMNLRVMLAKIIRALLIVLGVLVALPLVGIDITVLSVFGGALGVGLGLGLQKIASNYVSGFIILLDRSVRIGDTVTVDNRSGTVTQLTNRYVVLKSLDGTESIIPNDTLVTSTVVNQSYSDKRVRLALPVQISYASPLERAMEIMLQAAKSHPRVLTDPAPGVYLREFADNGVSLELGFWISDPQEGLLNLRSDINLEVWREFKKHGIELPFPQREVRIIGQARDAGGKTA